jgi:hypothetical protein
MSVVLMEMVVESIVRLHVWLDAVWSTVTWLRSSAVHTRVSLNASAHTRVVNAHSSCVHVCVCVAVPEAVRANAAVAVTGAANEEGQKLSDENFSFCKQQAHSSEVNAQKKTQATF